MANHGKKFTAAQVRARSEEARDPRTAIALIKEMASARFDESVEAAYRLGVDPRQADQIVRGTVALPHGTGKSIRVAVFAAGEQARDAEAAGADIVGGKELAEEITKGRALDFDLAIATPELMAEVGKLGKVLGPRGLMPNPKAGTVTQDVGKAVREFKGGRIEYRTDRYGNVHGLIGKVSFETDQLLINLAAFTDELVRSRPASAKGRYIRNLTLSSTMGPGVRIDPGSIDELASLAH